MFHLEFINVLIEERGQSLIQDPSQGRDLGLGQNQKREQGKRIQFLGKKIVV